MNKTMYTNLEKDLEAGEVTELSEPGVVLDRFGLKDVKAS